MRHRTSKAELEDQLTRLEVDSDILRHRINRREAEEIVEAQGMKPEDELYEFEVEVEMDRIWEEQWEEEHRWERRRWEREMQAEEEMRNLKNTPTP